MSLGGFFLAFILVLSQSVSWAQYEVPEAEPVDLLEEMPSAVEEEVPIILRGPASVRSVSKDTRARVMTIHNSKRLSALSTSNDWDIGEILALESQTTEIGIIAFVIVTDVQSNQDGTYDVTAELLRQSRVHIVQTGDQLLHLDLRSANNNYKGTTDLLVREASKEISSKYKPLFTQGFAVGETAQTLWENEMMVNFLGNFSYGLRDWLSVGTFIPGNFFGAANVNAKGRFYKSFSNVVSAGLSYAKIPNETSSTLNLNLYWDSISSEVAVSHTLLTISLFSFDQADDTAAIKSLGTSSLQTGTEFILSSWDRILLGPSYNFEKKAVGGYISYVKIWDQFHATASLNATDVADLKLNWDLKESVNGYFFLVDFYWRF